MSRPRWIIAVTFLIAAILVTLPAAIGLRLAAALRQGVVPLGPVSTITVDHFQRGWLSSKARLQLQLDHGLLPALVLHTRFEQGPWAFGSDYWPVALRAISRVVPDSPWCGRWLAPCDQLRIDSTLGWHGTTRHRLTAATLTVSPPLTPVPINWQRLAVRLSLPPAGKARPTRLRVTAKRLALPQLTLRHPDLTLRTKPSGPLGGVVIHLSFAGATANGRRWGPMRLAFTAMRVDGRQLSRFLRQPTTYDPAALLSGEKLLARHPELRLRGHWQTPYGPLSLGVKARLQPVNLLHLVFGRAGPLALIDRASGRLNVSKSLAERLLEWRLRQQQPSAQARNTARALLRRWRQAGFVTLQNNVYHCRFTIEDNRLIVNGATAVSGL